MVVLKEKLQMKINSKKVGKNEFSRRVFQRFLKVFKINRKQVKQNLLFSLKFSLAHIKLMKPW